MAYVRDEFWRIPDEGTISNAINRGPNDIIGVLVPFTNVQSTSFTFEGSTDGTNFFPILYEGTAVSVSRPAAKSFVTLPPEKLHGIPWIRVKPSATETSGPIDLYPIFRRYF